MEAILPLVEEVSNHLFLQLILLLICGILNIFFPPIPMEGLVVWGGYVTSNTFNNMIMVWFFATLGATIGGGLLYNTAFNLGPKLIEFKWLKHRFSHDKIDKIRVWFKKYGVLTVYGAKLIPGMSTFIIICSGFFKLKKRQVIPAIFFSNLLFYGPITLFGKIIHDYWVYVKNVALSNWIFIFGLIVIIGSAGLFVFYKTKRKTGND